MDIHEQGIEFSEKAGVSGRPRASADGSRLNEQKHWRKPDIYHQRGQYYEQCSRSIVLQELKKK